MGQILDPQQTSLVTRTTKMMHTMKTTTATMITRSCFSRLISAVGMTTATTGRASIPKAATSLLASQQRNVGSLAMGNAAAFATTTTTTSSSSFHHQQDYITSKNISYRSFAVDPTNHDCSFTNPRYDIGAATNTASAPPSISLSLLSISGSSVLQNMYLSTISSLPISFQWFVTPRDVVRSTSVTCSCSNAMDDQTTTSMIPSSLTDDLFASLLGGIWFIKRTFQPSLLRKKRKSGFLKRKKTVGGRKILKRRRAKGRARLFGA